MAGEGRCSARDQVTGRVQTCLPRACAPPCLAPYQQARHWKRPSILVLSHLSHCLITFYPGREKKERAGAGKPNCAPEHGNVVSHLRLGQARQRNQSSGLRGFGVGTLVGQVGQRRRFWLRQPFPWVGTLVGQVGQRRLFARWRGSKVGALAVSLPAGPNALKNCKGSRSIRGGSGAIGARRNATNSGARQGIGVRGSRT